jgi:leucyl aminopeptidase (aminopeptidase T)
MLNIEHLMPGARRVIEEALGIQAGEQVTIVTDLDRSVSITTALADCARHSGAEVVIITMSPRDHGGIDPPPTVGAAIAASQAVIMQTSFATIHTDTLRRALARGVRVCEFWGITEDMMVRGGLTEDPAWLDRTSSRLADLMTRADQARLTTPDGTDLHLVLAGRKAIPVPSTARTSGIFCSLPAGESAIAPLEGKANGKVTKPYLVEHREIARPKERLNLYFQDGNLVQVQGGAEAQLLEKLIAENGSTARNLAEFAVGTNRQCRLDVGVREAKKAWGTAHIAIGDNRSIGGVVGSPLHIDFIMLRPTIWLDGREVVHDGNLQPA